MQSGPSDSGEQDTGGLIRHVNLDGQSSAHFGDNHYHGFRLPPHAMQYNVMDEVQRRQQATIKVLMDSLKFFRMGAHERSVAMALPLTGEWILSDSRFRSWTDPDQAAQHHGFFWIKGKPGSGKSTMMKTLKAWAEKQRPRETVISHFFNARSTIQFERSTLGLWQSMVHQLLTIDAASQPLFLQTFATKVYGERVEAWEERELQNFFINYICRHNSAPVNIFVDALDEGSDDEMQALVTWLQSFALRASMSGVILRTCLSSRHYPYLYIAQGISLVLDDELDHRKDIEVYLESSLYGRDGDGDGEGDRMRTLQSAVCQQSKGIFLWVVLVVATLNKTWSQGWSVEAMMQRLREVPTDLHNLFSELLLRDPEHIDEMFALFRWVFYARRPLSSAELFTAITYRDTSVHKHVETLPSDDSIQRYLLHRSRGLIEFTLEPRPTVQFIHQTVRDYLRSRYEYGPSTESNLNADYCHATMAKLCLQYLLDLPLSTSTTNSQTRMETHSFARYAATSWFDHSIRSRDQSSLTLVPQLFKENSRVLLWIDLGCLEILHYSPKLSSRPESKSELHGRLLTNLALKGYWELIEILLAAGMEPDGPVPPWCPVTPLASAILMGNQAAVTLFIHYNIFEDITPQTLNKALWLASTNNHTRVAKLLEEAGATRLDGIFMMNPSSHVELASWLGHFDIVEDLIAAPNNIVKNDRKPVSFRPQSGEVFKEIIRSFGGEIDSAPESHLSVELKALCALISVARQDRYCVLCSP